ncbi:hypothetical protein AgCh_021145 [Apium graveolens]
METEKKENAATDNKARRKTSETENDEAFKKCMEENKEDGSKCKPKIEAFKSSIPVKPLFPLMLRSGYLTDV